jgi:hypothetical protein
MTLAAVALASPLYLTFPFTIMPGRRGPLAMVLALVWLFFAGLFHCMRFVSFHFVDFMIRLFFIM